MSRDGRRVCLQPFHPPETCSASSAGRPANGYFTKRLDQDWLREVLVQARQGTLPGSVRTAWEHVIPFLAFPPEVRRVIYMTNAIEALNRQLRKTVKTKGHFPNEDAARKLIYLAIHNAVPQWIRTREWTKALMAFKIHFGDRLPD